MPLLRLLLWIVLILLAVLGAQVLLHDPGTVLVRFHGYDYTTTVAAVLFGTLAVLVVAWLLWRVVTWPFAGWRRRRDRLARARLGDGFDALHQGRYARAEELLVQAGEDEPEFAGQARLGAARAALARGDLATARAHVQGLGEAHATTRALALADLALAEDRPTDALVALDAPAAQPLPPRGLLLRAQALAASGQAEQAYGLLGSLRKQEALPAARLDELQEEWAAAALREAPDRNALAARWDAIARPLRSEPRVVAAYVDRAHALGWDGAAPQALEEALANRWDERLAARYALLADARPEPTRAQLERWLQAHPRSPALLLALARIARAQGDWPRAQDLLLRALAEGAGAPAWEELGHGYSQAGDESRARLAYANALRAARDQPVVALPAGEAAPIALEDRDAHGLPRLSG
ncbi:MAG: heme biosynthesis HemY N-terminal domain-containing protein [Lysobacteraceae bacterium]